MTAAGLRLIPLLLLELVSMAAVMGAVLFAGAGSWDWPSGWAFLGLFTAISLAVSLWLAAVDPALLEERLKPPMRRGQKPWDRVFMGLVMLIFMAWLALIGVDARRMGWSQVPIWAQTLGALLLVASFLGVAWVYRENSFASSVVRVQAERGQRVISTGPYALVRHPMYAFALPMFVGIPLLAGSGWGTLIAPIAAIGIGFRAVGEEGVLKAELAGYEDYARRVRWRFAPGVW